MFIYHGFPLDGSNWVSMTLYLDGKQTEYSALLQEIKFSFFQSEIQPTSHSVSSIASKSNSSNHPCGNSEYLEKFPTYSKTKKVPYIFKGRHYRTIGVIVSCRNYSRSSVFCFLVGTTELDPLVVVTHTMGLGAYGG